MPITETEIKRLQPKDKDQWINTGHPNLFIKVAPTGTMSWVYRSERGGGRMKKVLGRYPRMNLSAAVAVSSKINSEALPENRTGYQLAMDWIDRHVVNLNSPRDPTRYAERFAALTKHKRIEDITLSLLMDDLVKYKDTSPDSAGRCLIVYGQILKHGVMRGWVSRNLLESISGKSLGIKKNKRKRVYTHDEIRWLATINGTIWLWLLRTGCRFSEALKGYVDGDKWRIDVTKNGKPHWVHLTPQMKALMVPGWNDLSYPAYAQRFQRAREKASADPSLNIGADIVQHDLRRTFRTIAAELGCQMHVSKAITNHSKGDVIEETYNRHDYADERIEWTERINARIDEILAGS